MLDHAMCGELTNVRLAIEVDGVDPDYRDCDFWGDTALIRSCYSGQLHIVKYLILNQHCNVDCAADNGDTAMTTAVRFKRNHIVAFIEGFLSWQRKAESSTYLTRREAASAVEECAAPSPPKLKF